MYRAVLALSVLAVSALPAAAQVKLNWTTTETDNGANLAFGTEDSSQLLFVCERGKPLALVNVSGAKGLKGDDPAKVIFTAGKLKKELTGKAVAADTSIDVEAGSKLEDVKALLASGKTLTVEVKGAKQQIPLAGAPEAYVQFEAFCK
ncbi:hypothetical protein J5J86_02335 [Aquabacter sp. L1I39]|uniref:hypothetical protein n=1 Tax=Aquabacter sp. L1I39 TaxID=2820278 RepID=UPI001ADB2E9C|nr:hypothetical protein [Aquabacter sp. L1I39]QTL04216.1 hypothetical protein J5J86_02335 [Aquabacter sp. L1I39]